MEVNDIISYHDNIAAEKRCEKGMNYGVGRKYFGPPYVVARECGTRTRSPLVRRLRQED
jgi:hypothetical protein